MQMKFLALTLLSFTISAYAAAAPDIDSDAAASYCRWYGEYTLSLAFSTTLIISCAGTGPHCKGYCPHDTYQLTTGEGGCGNGQEFSPLDYYSLWLNGRLSRKLL